MTGVGIGSDLRVKIGGDLAGLEGSLRRAGRDIDRFASDVTRRFRNLGLGLAAVFIPTTIMGVNFEKNMRFVAAVTNATEKEFEGLIEAAREMGRSTEYTSSQASESLKFLGMAGFTATQAIEALPGTIDLATAGMMDLGQAADIATNILTQMGLEVKELGRVNDVLAKVQSTSNTNIEQAAQAFVYAGTTARRFKMSVEEVAASIGLLAKAGIRSTLAGTTLSQAMRRLANEAGPVKEIMDKYSISLTDAQGNMRNFTDVILDMIDANIDAIEASKMLGMRASNLQVLFDMGSEAVLDYINSIYDSEGATDKLAKSIRESLWGSFKTLWSAMESVGLTVFEMYKEDLKELVQKVTEYVRLLEELILKNKELIEQKVHEIFEKISAAIEKIVNFINSTPGLATGGMVAYIIGGTRGFAAVMVATALLAKLWEALFPQVWEDEAKKRVEGFVKEQDKIKEKLKEIDYIEAQHIKGNEERAAQTRKYYDEKRELLNKEMERLQRRIELFRTTLGMETEFSKILAEQKKLLETPTPEPKEKKKKKFERQSMLGQGEILNETLDYYLAVEEAIEAILDKDKLAIKERERLEADLTDKIKQMTLKSKDYRIWAINQEIAAYRKLAEEGKISYALLAEYEKAATDQMNKDQSDFSEHMMSGIKGWAMSMSRTLSDMVWGSKTSFKEILTSFGKMVTEMIMQYIILALFKNAAGASKGLAFNQGRVIPMAKGGFITQPTLIPMKNGDVVFAGEAGSEAVMPLKRTSRGELGVNVAGATQQPRNVIIYMDNPQFQDLETQQQHMTEIAARVTEAMAPNAIIKSYKNDERIRTIIRNSL